MSLKMKELTKLTKEAKSTILYYIKEGLLPQPKKPKPNVHLYDERCIDIIKFIKYLQQNYSYSISEIKEIFNSIDIKNGESFLMMVKALELATLLKGERLLTKEEFLKEASISEITLEEFIKKGYLINRDSGYSLQEIDILNTIKKLQNLNLEDKLLTAYVNSAKELAKIEFDIWKKLFENSKNDTIDEHQLAFDTTLKLKPYILNIHTLKEYYKAKIGGK